MGTGLIVLEKWEFYFSPFFDSFKLTANTFI